MCMETNAGKYLNRPIAENEEELLDEIWDSLPPAEDGEQMLDKYYRNVKQRIARHTYKRRIAYVSMGAAVLCLFLLLFSRSESRQTSPVLAQLHDMGVAINKQEVRLMLGDSIVANLNTSVKMNAGLNARIALQTATGEKIILKQEKPLKIYVPAGKRFDLELTDGSHIWLNSDTWFEYPATFASANERRVRIEGEGFFDVKPDSTKPFYVEISGGESIRVLGTSFNVSAYADNEENITTLVSGKIEYTDSMQAEPIVLFPNEQVRVNKTTKNITKNEVNTSEFAMWKEGFLYFNNERLPILAKQLARMYGIEIEVAEKYNNTRFSGMIRYERGIDYIAKLLTTTSNIRCSIENGIIYLE